MSRITLYQFEHCPFCAKVRAKLHELGIKFKRVEVPIDREHPERKSLAKKSGVLTVPVIEIAGKFIGESEKIIRHLEEVFSKKKLIKKWNPWGIHKN